MREELDGHADEFAERTVVHGGMARGTLQAAPADSRLTPYPAEASDGAEHLWAFSAALVRAAKSARETIEAADEQGDVVSADVFTEVARGLDTLLWKVEAHVANRAGSRRRGEAGVSCGTGHRRALKKPPRVRGGLWRS